MHEEMTRKDISLFDSNNTNPSSTTVDSSQHYPFYIYGQQQQQYFPSYENNIGNYKAMLIQEAEKLHTNIAKRTAEEVINEYL